MQARQLLGYTVRAGNRQGDPIIFLASTEGVARDGMIIEQGGWELDAYRRSPVFLWSHRYEDPPIGKTVDVGVDRRGLVAEVVFDSDPFAQKIERLYREGMLTSVSVGWNSLEIAQSKSVDQPTRILRAELLDISGVSVPSDSNAIALARAAYRAGLADDDGIDLVLGRIGNKLDERSEIWALERIARMMGVSA